MLLLRLVLLSLSLLSSIRSFPFVPFGERSEDTFVCYFRFRSALLQSLSFQRIFVRVFALPTVFSTVCLGENVLALFHRSIHVRCSTASLLRSRCVSNFCQLSFPGLRGGGRIFTCAEEHFMVFSLFSALGFGCFLVSFFIFSVFFFFFFFFLS